jgi:hypothetical protein
MILWDVNYLLMHDTLQKLAMSYKKQSTFSCTHPIEPIPSYFMLCYDHIFCKCISNVWLGLANDAYHHLDCNHVKYFNSHVQQKKTHIAFFLDRASNTLD